jgi:CHAT domain-containing protein
MAATGLIAAPQRSAEGIGMTATSGRETLLSVLGGSLIAEELRGDFAAARAAADAALAAARGSGDDSAVAVGALDAGLVATLQGDVGWAIGRLEEALALGLGDADAALAATLRRLALELRLAVAPGGGGINAFHLTLLRGSITFPPRPRTDSIETRLIYEVLVGLPVSRNILDMTRWLVDADLLDGQLRDLPAPDAGLPGGWSGFVELAAADLCRRAGRLALGRERLAVALERYRAKGDVVGEGVCHLAEGDWACAPLSTPSTWDLLPLESSGAGSMLASLELAELGMLGAPPPEAEAAYERAAACFAASGAARGMAAVDLRRAYLAILGGVPEDAWKHAGRARAGFQTAGDRFGAQLASAHQALAAVWTGDLTEDASTAGSVGAWGRDEGSFSFALGIGAMFTRAGRHAQLRTGGMERSLACHRLAQMLFTELGAQSNAAQSLVDQGDVRQMIGDWPGASLAYDEALAMLDAMTRERPDITRELAHPHVILLSKQRGLAIILEDPDALNRVQSQLQAKRAQLLALEPEGGFDPVLLLLGLLDDQILESAVLEPLHRALHYRDEFSDSQVARERDKALAAARQAGDRGDWLEVAVRLSLGDRAGARDPYFRLLARMDTAAAGGLLPSNLADLIGNLSGPLLKQAQQDALNNQAAFLVQLHAWPEARQRLDALDELAGPGWWEQTEDPWVQLDLLAQAYEGTGEAATARQFYELAMETLERRREQLTAPELRVAQSGVAAVRRLFLHAARAALRAAEQTTSDTERGELHAQAFAAAERGRARVLLDMMSTSAALARAAPGELEPVRGWRELSARLAADRAALVAARADAERAREAQRSAAIATADATVAQLERTLGENEDALAAIERALSRDHPTWRKIVAPGSQVLALHDVAGRIPPDTVLITYLFGDDEVFGWAVGSDGLLRPHRAETETWALKARITQFSRRVGGGTEAWDDDGPALSEAFLAPFAPELERYKHVIFVPWDHAHQLPFSALPWNGARLIESHAVSVLPSAAALRPLEPGPNAVDGPVLAVGNPARMVYRLLGEPRAREWEPLPWTGPEAAFAAAQWQGGETWHGEAATEAKLRERIADFPVVHLASHAVVQSVPLLSVLVLAGGDGLTLYDILGLDLSGARLVVLSACATARGTVTNGDEVLGLSWGVLATGARAAIASLWKVDARSAPLLMAAFYRRLRAGDSPAIALQAAQLHVRQLDAATARAERDDLLAVAEADGQTAPAHPSSEPDYQHPRHWAPYVLIGT